MKGATGKRRLERGGGKWGGGKGVAGKGWRERDCPYACGSVSMCTWQCIHMYVAIYPHILSGVIDNAKSKPTGAVDTAESVKLNLSKNSPTLMMAPLSQFFKIKMALIYFVQMTEMN